MNEINCTPTRGKNLTRFPKVSSKGRLEILQSPSVSLVLRGNIDVKPLNSGFVCLNS